jgi:hypothetical protein
MVITAMMTELFHVTRQGGGILLAGMRDMISTASGQQQPLLNLPKDPRTAYARLRLNPVTETYVCCPKCLTLTLYCPSTENPVTKQNPHPLIPVCQERMTDQSDICGEKLWKREIIHNKVHFTPKLTYVRQILKEWLGRLLSRPGIEDILDSYPQEASKRGSGGEMDDIWSSPVIQNLQGPDGEPFLKGPKGEGRYLFSLATDGFNPFYNKTAKQVVTCTGFFAVLLNFPPHLRYLFENMCLLGVGPGPSGPSYREYNSFLRLIVQEFLELWKGVFYIRTHNYRSGRHTKAMVVPLVSDALAARLAAGFTAITSTAFCMECEIDMAHIEQFWRIWAHRDHDEHMKNALAWKAAPTLAAQESIAQKTGVRYSALLELPYWKAVCFVLTEPMHVLDLNLISHHCRELFQIDLEQNGGDGSEARVARPPRPTAERIKQVLQVFQQHRNNPNLLNQVLKNPWVNFNTLWHICNDHNLRISGQRKDWFVLRIETWVCFLLLAIGF